MHPGLNTPYDGLDERAAFQKFHNLDANNLGIAPTSHGNDSSSSSVGYIVETKNSS